MAGPVFISHSSDDVKVARAICAAIELRGVPCWIAGRDVGPGDNYGDAIVDAIERAQAMVLVFSSSANNSGEIKKELALASQHRVTVIPVRVEDITPSQSFRYELATRQWIDMFVDWDQALKRLTDKIAAIHGIGQAAAAPSPKPTPQPPPAASRRSLPVLLAAAGAVAVVVAVLAGAVLLWPRPAATPDGSSQGAAKADRAAPAPAEVAGAAPVSPADQSVGEGAQRAAPAGSAGSAVDAAPPQGPIDETRRALVLGVENYADPQIQRLPRADADATDVAADLAQLGFDKKNITLATDLRGKADFQKRFDAFLATVQEGDTIFFFFSGHGAGVEAEDANYLLFADLKSLFSFTREKLSDAERRQPAIVSLRMSSFAGPYAEAEIAGNGVSTAKVVQSIAAKKPKAAFIVLDACRSLAVPPAQGAAAGATDSGSRLLPPKDLPSGFMILHSAALGEQAIESFGRDDIRRNSLFTQVLRSEMPRPGQTLPALGERVRLVVRAFATSEGYQQDPEYFQNLGRNDDFMLVGGIGAERFHASSDACDDSQADWAQISQHPRREALERHMRRFAACPSAQLARRALISLLGSNGGSPATAVARDNQLDDCDRLAAADFDSARPLEAPGVPLDRIDPDAATAACGRSVQRNPAVARFLFNLGRAEQAAGDAMRMDDPARSSTLRRAYLTFEDAAKRDYTPALFAMAMLIDFGAPGEFGGQRADALLNQAAERGFAPAAYLLGLAYEEGAFGVTRDVKQGFDWLQKAAEGGSVAAMVEVGEALWRGTDASEPRKNPRGGALWLQRAAETGSDLARLNLGLHYLRGSWRSENNRTIVGSVKPDRSLSLLWFGRAAENGDPAAQYRLARMMEDGSGLPAPQPEISQRYDRLAAAGGDPEAEIELADLLLSGRALAPRRGNKEPLELLQQALAQGSARAARRLAAIYRDGLSGQDKSPSMAMAYAYRAIELSTTADPTTEEGDPLNELAAGLMLAEMVENHEAEDASGNPLLTKGEIERLQRFYGAVDPATKKVRLRRLDAPLHCDKNNPDHVAWKSIWIWDWGRVEAPTEPQFQSLEARTGCDQNDALRRALIAAFDQARVSKTPFADAVQRQINQRVGFGAAGPGPTLSEAAAIGDRAPAGEIARKEAGGDVVARIEALIKEIDAANGLNSAAAEDIGARSVFDALTQSCRQANLTRFETFLGENWSDEQLRGMVIDRASNALLDLIDGANRRVVAMSDLEQVITKAARSVHASLFETSELLAANRSASLFGQRLDQMPDHLAWDQGSVAMMQMLRDASIAAVAPFDGALRRDPDAYALRYRAQRIIFDCLSDNVQAIAASDSGFATVAEIEQRIADAGKNECSKWVAAQLLGPDGKVKPQEPMPLRAIWSEEGAKDDPSMYGQAADLQ